MTSERNEFDAAPCGALPPVHTGSAYPSSFDSVFQSSFCFDAHILKFLAGRAFSLNLSLMISDSVS
jgi:hypothetical protein